MSRDVTTVSAPAIPPPSCAMTTNPITTGSIRADSIDFADESCMRGEAPTSLGSPPDRTLPESIRAT